MQFDQDVSQLIDWLKEKSQQAILWFQHDNFSGSLLKELWEKGYEPASRWLHITAVCFAFASDFLKPLFPRFTLKLALGGATFPVLPFLGIRFGIVSEQLGATIIVFCVIAAILSLCMLVLQRGHVHGALAKLVPGVEELQKKLGVIGKGLDDLLKGQKRLERLMPQAAARLRCRP